MYDAATYYWGLPGFRGKRNFSEHPDGGWNEATDQLGFRKLTEISDEKPGLRILVTGDSHTEGVIPIHESFSNVLESMLNTRLPERNIEVLNGGKGGFSFYNYVGVLEKFLYLKPDVFILGVYGGNDFRESLQLHRYFGRMPPPQPWSAEWDGRWKKAVKDDTPLIAQSFSQLLAFKQVPAEQSLGLEAGRIVTGEIKRICDEHGIRFICVLIPAMSDAQGELIPDRMNHMRNLFGLSVDDLEINDRICDSYVDLLSRSGVRYIDMRPVFRAQEHPAYWFADLHINTLGHLRIAEALLPLVEDML